MKHPWHIQDIIDLEYFLREDEDDDEAAVTKRDRRILRDNILPELGQDETPHAKYRRNALRIWLGERRRQEDASPVESNRTPGELFTDTVSLFSFALLVLGFLAGTGLAFTALRYHGIEPVNVSTYLGIFVLLQMLLVILLAFWPFVRRIVGSVRLPSIHLAIIAPLLSSIFNRVSRRALAQMPAANRQDFSHGMGVFRVHRRIYGSLLYWRAFILSQVLGVGFNVGVLSGSVIKVMGTDLAFGWQSTLRISSEAVYGLVRALAVPWSPLVSAEIAHPTLDQIAGSRMVLKDGIYTLATPDLVSWWPFLLMAVLCYGFLPRVLAFLGGHLALKRGLRRLEFDHASCMSLWYRMTTPHLETEGQPLSADETIVSDALIVGGTGSQIADTGGKRPNHILTPEDVSNDLAAETLSTHLSGMLGSESPAPLIVSLDFDNDRELLQEQFASRADEDERIVVLLQEAWQPPIAENLEYLQRLRELLNEKDRIHVALLGREGPDQVLRPVSVGNLRMWIGAVESLGDPYTTILRPKEVA